MKLKLDDPAYPRALRELVNPPPVLTTSGPLEPRRAVAIVGSRSGCDEALAFAHDLAFSLAKAGVVVVSGGAVGVDAAAHRGALAAGGTTWVVSPTGKDRLYPPDHHDLFAGIAASPDSRMLWPFPDDCDVTRKRLLYRNGVLAALAEALVVVQAHFQSGSRNAAAWARSLNRPVWAMTAAPWMLSFCGTSSDIERGLAQPLCSSRQLFRALQLGDPTPGPQLSLFVPKRPPAKLIRRIPEDARKAPETEAWSTEERLVFTSLLTEPMHLDQIIEITGLPVPPVVTALLTLRLKDVVVEGPDGFFRRICTS